MAEALFEIVDGAYVPTELGRGPWDRRALHGGAPGALLARELEGLVPGAFVARVTIEFVRPVPLEPLALEARVARAGRQVQRSEAVMRSGETEVARAWALHLRRKPLETAIDPALSRRGGESVPPPPEAGEPFGDPPGVDWPALHNAGMDARVVGGGLREVGPGVGWFRLAVPVVPGETPSALSRVVAACDFGNGISSVLPWGSHAFLNPDITVYLHREARGEWIGVDAVTHAGPDGVGLAEARVLDRDGPIGRSAQSLILDRRA